MSSAAATIRATAIPGEHVRIAVNKDTEPFWQAAKERRLVAPQCSDCQTLRLPPTPFCPNCQSKAVNWVELSGEAIVYSFAVVHGFPGMPDLVLVRCPMTALCTRSRWSPVATGRGVRGPLRAPLPVAGIAPLTSHS